MPQAMQDLRIHATRRPHAAAIVCGGRSVTYGELEALANRLASIIRDSGLQRGDHAVAVMGNRPELLALAWAAWRTGIYLTPLSTALTPQELARLIEHCDARLVLADGALPEIAAELPTRVVPAAGQIRWLMVGGTADGFELLETELACASPEAAVHEPPGALMMTTSGTTGAPKGVIRPLLPPDWRGTPPFAADLITLFDVGGEEVRYLSTAPLYHAAPLRFALAVTAGGGCVHVMDGFDAREALDLLQREGITHSQWVPAMFQRLLALPDHLREAFHAPAHRIAIHGAAPCPVAVKRAMITWWGPILLEYYSGSEGVGLTMLDSHEALAHPGSVGRARKGQLHVVDDSGRTLAPGSTGLVCFSGVAPFAYHRAPEKTAARTLPGGLQTFGDIGHVDAEGWLYLTDRLDDMIISGGVNLYPQEIEAAITEVPGVWECAVVGVPDERFGERPAAFVVPQRDHQPQAVLDAVRRRCQQVLGRFKQPVAFHLLQALPRTPTGKLLRRELRRSYSSDPESPA